MSAAQAASNRTSRASVLPIEFLPDPFRLRDDTQWYYRSAIDEIGKRFLEPLGHDIWEMFGKVVGPSRDGGIESGSLDNEYAKRVLKNEARPYIFVDEVTTKKDVEGALQWIKVLEGYPTQEGRPKRDRLLALQCAVFYDRHGWSYEKLADHYGWKDYTLASKRLRG